MKRTVNRKSGFYATILICKEDNGPEQVART